MQHLVGGDLAAARDRADMADHLADLLAQKVCREPLVQPLECSQQGVVRLSQRLGVAAVRDDGVAVVECLRVDRSAQRAAQGVEPLAGFAERPNTPSGSIRSGQQSSLFMTVSRRCSCRTSKSGDGIVSPACVASSRRMMIRARAMLDSVRSMPMRSSRSSVVRIPAVSRNRNSTPSMLVRSSMTSRVVPAMSETRARSSLSRRFSRVDFPAFGARRSPRQPPV